MDEGATVTAYVDARLCPEARAELMQAQGRAGSLRLRAVCLPNRRERGRLDLATVGANARRATEDSTAVAYIEPPDPAAVRFSEPLLESADIPHLTDDSGSAAIARLLRALEDANPDSLRESLLDELR